MGLRQLFIACRARTEGFLKARRIKSKVFSGTPVLAGIAALEGSPGTWSLTFRNGLMLTLGEAGILDYQDPKFRQFIGEAGESSAPGNHGFLVQLHKIVLKSLLRHITYPGLDMRQRENAAEAATRLWLASEKPSESAPVPDLSDNGSRRAAAASITS
jgi:hypothetical protein